MCDQRDRLMDYLYDEAAPAERRLVEAHLEGCPECRDEVRAFRRVREDLLAWEVPETTSVWTPFAPPVVVPWYRQVPAWALTAAASVMFLMSVAGGVMAQTWLSVATPATPVEAASRVTPTGAADVPPVTPAGSPLQGLDDAQVLALVRAELGRLQRVTATRQSTDAEALVAKAAEQQWQQVYKYLTMAAEERMLERKSYDERISRLSMQLDGVQQVVELLVQQRQATKGQQ